MKLWMPSYSDDGRDPFGFADAAGQALPPMCRYSVTLRGKDSETEIGSFDTCSDDSLEIMRLQRLVMRASGFLVLPWGAVSRSSSVGEFCRQCGAAPSNPDDPPRNAR